MKRNFDKTQALLVPSLLFDSPEKIESCTKLTRQEKIKALLNWKDQCIQLQKATEEGMGGQTHALLKSINKTLLEIQS